MSHEPTFKPLPFLHSVAPLPVAEDPDVTLVLSRLAQLDETNDQEWVVRQLQLVRWANHALVRLNLGATEYDDASLRRPLDALLEELAEEAADLGAWGAIAHHVLRGRDFEPDARELLAAALRDVASAGAEAWARIAEARDLLATLPQETCGSRGQQ